jgi:DNA topoisomerase-1
MSNLRYISDDEPGFTRKKWGRGFTYQDTEGETIRDPELREWIESIVIPPAWTDVWISPYKNGHILATGRDDAGRKQYRYHPQWQEQQQQKKFDELAAFGRCLPTIREATDRDLRQRNVTRSRILAAIVRLLEQTLIRVGNEEYAEKNDSYGLTTLTDHHAEVEGSKVIFDFAGKSGKEHTIVLRDARLARIVQRSQDIPGYELFQYYDEGGKHHVIDAADVNDYLHEISGESFTAKVFRTWGGSRIAVQYLCEECEDTDTQTAAKNCVTHVAEELGNTVAISRQYYIHPAILEAHENGNLCDFYEREQSKQRGKCDLSPEEAALLALIESK